VKLWLGYAVAGLALVGAGLLLSRLFMGPDDWMGVLIGGAIAYPVQLVAFGLLLRFRNRMKTFLVVWAGGTLVRMAVVLGAGLYVATNSSLPPAHFLLALAGFFFGLLLLESAFFRPGTMETN
jgi:hypothetical protein